MEILKENYSRLCYISAALFILELLLVLNQGPLYKAGAASLSFIASSLLLIPVLFYIKHNLHTVSMRAASIAAHVYCASVLVFGAFVALNYQGSMDLVHMYIMAVFGVLNFIYMRPKNAAALLFSVYIIFALLLGYYQPNTRIAVMILANTLICNVFAFLLSLMIYKARVAAFINQKLMFTKQMQLQELAQLDRMTGLLNHEVSILRLEQELKGAQYGSGMVSMIFADIDNLKEINDNYGHLAGDAVIKAVASTLRKTVRSSDIVGRYGGNEFIIILPNTNINAAHALWARICKTMETAHIHDGVKVTLSCGISEFTGEELHDFIKATDEKLYAAKRAKPQVLAC